MTEGKCKESSSRICLKMMFLSEQILERRREGGEKKAVVNIRVEFLSAEVCPGRSEQ